DLDRALDDLAKMHPRQALMVVCRFFGGLDIAETAVLLEVSESTILRDWRAARAWLARQLRRAGCAASVASFDTISGGHHGCRTVGAGPVAIPRGARSSGNGAAGVPGGRVRG